MTHESAQLPSVTPSMEGPCGKAWMCDVAAMGRDAAARAPGRAQPPAELTVCAWVVFAPDCHPVWHSYSIGVISLRELPPWPPAHVHRPGSTHEVFVMALDPDQPVAVDQQPHHLWPLNFSGQFTEPSDEAARARVEQTVRDIVEGRLSPDTDHMQEWVARFSGSNLRGTPVPDMIIGTPGGIVAIGTGANMAKTLDAISQAARPAAPGVH